MKEILKLVRNCIYYLLYYKNYKKITKNEKIHILSFDDTIHKIVNEGYSISRFGDGEFKWMLNIKQNSFQDSNEELTKRLKEVIQTDNKKILICLPDNLIDISNRTLESKAYWSKFCVKNFTQLKKYILSDKIYGNTNITRPYIGYKNKDKNLMKTKFDRLRLIWNKRDILIVEGEYTKLGIGNDLFKNSKSIKRIICPSKNAYENIKEIKEEIINNVENRLVLIALGPTATILAYDLGTLGIQAIDIGHVDIEYCWYLMGAKKKIKIDGKFVSEAGGKEKTALTNAEYENQIIKKIIV